MNLQQALLAVMAATPCEAPGPTEIGPRVTRQADEAIYHPVLQVVQAALAPLSAADRAMVLNFRLDGAGRHRDAARTGLTALGLRADLPETLPERVVPDSDWPLTSVKKRVRDLHFRLRVGQHVRDRCENTDTDLAAAALADRTQVANAAANLALAAELMLQIRCLADLYTRWEVGTALTRLTQFASPPSTPAQLLARVLAYWRIEGDLAVPPEADTFVASDSPASTPLVPLPPGRTRLSYIFSPRPYMYCVTMLALKQNFGPPIDLDLTKYGTARELTDIAFAIVLGGLDILFIANFQKGAESLLAPFVPKDTLDWPALNRIIPPISEAGARADAKQASDRRLALVNPIEVGAPPAAPAAWRGSPVGSAGYAGPYSGPAAEYVSLVLGEGVRYLNRIASGPQRFGSGAPGRIPELIVYAFYHQGEKAAAMLASAAAYAVMPASKSPMAAALKAALPAQARDATTPLGGLLRDIRKASAANAVALAVGNWSTLRTVLGTTPVLVALADYIRTEGETVWKSWAWAPGEGGSKDPGPRANIIGYDLLYRYLVAAFGGVP